MSAVVNGAGGPGPARLRVRPVSPATFKETVAQFTTGVTVVTTCDDDGTRHGLTANAFTAVSLEPPLILVCIAHRAHTLTVLRQARRFAVNILAAGQRDIAMRFAQPRPDKYDGVLWRVGTLGVPLLDGCLGQLECRLHDAVTAGDHDLVLGYVVRASTAAGMPLVYHRSTFA